MQRFILTMILLCGFIPIHGMSKPDKLPEDEFERRRSILLDELRDLKAVAVFHSAPTAVRNNDVTYPYRQDSDFYYLTGWTSPDAILVLAPSTESDEKPEVILYVQPSDPRHEIWTGPLPGIEEAQALAGVDDARAYDDFNEQFGSIIRGKARLVISYGNHEKFRSKLQEMLDESWAAPAIIQDAHHLLGKYRLIKSDSEIAALQHAVDITGQSLTDAFRQIPSLSTEYEVQAAIEYGFKKRGTVRLGFPSIVGSGRNSIYLHYDNNYDSLDTEGLILMDVGAEWDYYSADITRTVPVDGTFSPEQKAIYELVLHAQNAAFESIKPGVPFRHPHEIAARVITQGLVDLGLLSGNVDTLVANQNYRRFFMHGLSHWLGLDVHDTGGYIDESGKPYTLKAGMVFTVEPGIYISSKHQDVDRKWWNIGVRIEDDVLVTSDGCRVLSSGIPKKVADIEAFMVSQSANKP